MFNHLCPLFFMFFCSLSPQFVYLILGVLLSLSSVAIIGVFSSLQKKELAGDVIAHATLPGVACSFMLTGNKNLLGMGVGSFVSGLFALFLIDYIPKHSKIKKDTAMGLILSIFFGFGILLITYLQHNGEEEQAGLANYLLGNIASLRENDIEAFFFLAIMIVITVLLFFPYWRLLSFDPAFAQTISMPVVFLKLLFHLLTVWTIVLGIQTVGILLIVAIFVTPVVTARYFSACLGPILFISAFLAALGGVAGLYSSFYIQNLPTGPTIVLFINFLGLLVFLSHPKKGFFAKKWAERRRKKRSAAWALRNVEKEGAGHGYEESIKKG